VSFDLNLALSRSAEGKALGPHPALMDRSVPVSVYSPGASRQDAVLSQREAMHHSQAYGGSEAMDHVYDCVNLYADSAATAPYRLEHEDGTPLVRKKTKGTPPDHNVGPEDLYRLLDAPNPFMLYDELVSLLVIDLLLVGNAYWFKWQVPESGRPLALYRLAPAHVKIVPGPFGPKRYEYQPPGARKPLKIDPTEVIHFRRPNPHSAYYGLGVIQGAGRAMDLDIAVTDTMASYYENKADPSLIVQSERRVPRDVFNKLRAQLRARASGTNRAGELLVLEAGLKAETLSANARDALFDKLSTMSRDRVYTKFRTAPELFGFSGSASGSNKVSDFRREFDNYALRPFLTKIARVVSASLTSAWGATYIIEHSTILPPEDATKVGGEIAKMPGVKVREVRKQYAQFGIPESTGDPEIDEMVLNLPTPEADENGMITLPDGTKVRSDKVGADRPLPGEPGRPPKPENTRAIGNASGKALSIEEIEARLDAIGAGRAEGKALAPDGARVTVGNVLPDEQRPSDPFVAARQVDIDAATDFIAAQLRDAATTLERGLLDTVEGKALKTSDIVKRIRESNAWGVFKDRVQTILEEGARQAAVSGVMHTGKTPEDEIDYDGIVKSTVHRPDGLRSIMRTVRDRLARRVRETRERDGERADYEAAIRAGIAEWSDGQVLAIADSEATEAYNEAVLTTLEMVGESEVYVVEEEDAPDKPCQDARGRVWPIEYARKNRKEHPRCRRAFLSLSDAAEAVA